jgi:hypothetical protein
MSATNAPESDRPFYITLVHGTWPRGFQGLIPFVKWTPRWFEAGSKFRQQLEQLLKSESDQSTQTIVFIEHCWSGHNSILQRDNAAWRLRKELDRQLSDNPRAERVVVCHSHGGNVALRAIAPMENLASNPIRLLTIATPFLDIVPSTNSKSLLVDYGLSLTLFYVMTSFMLMPMIEFVPWVLPAFSALWILIITYVAVRRILFDLPQFAGQIAAAGNIDTVPRGVEICVLRGIDDEASLALALASSIGRLTDVLVGLILPLTKIATLAACIVGLPIAADMVLNIVIPKSVIDWSLYLVTPIVVVIFVANFIGVAGMSILPIAKSFFGRELFWLGFQFDIAANSAPDIAGLAYICTLPATTETSRHSLYSNPHCLARLLSFITNDQRNYLQYIQGPNSDDVDDRKWRRYFQRLAFLGMFGFGGALKGPDYGRSSWSDRTRE